MTDLKTLEALEALEADLKILNAIPNSQRTPEQWRDIFKKSFEHLWIIDLEIKKAQREYKKEFGKEFDG